MKIRYYADAELREWHTHILSLLETIHTEHGIPIEVDRITSRFAPITDIPADVQHTTKETVYHRDFKNNESLAATIDRPPEKVYRFEGEYAIAGHVALVDGTVQWASTLLGDASGHGPGAEDQTPIDFLRDVSASPANRFCRDCCQLLDGNEKVCPNCGTELS